MPALNPDSMCASCANCIIHEDGMIDFLCAEDAMAGRLECPLFAPRDIIPPIAPRLSLPQPALPMGYVAFYVSTESHIGCPRVYVVARDSEDVWWYVFVDYMGTSIPYPCRSRPSVKDAYPYRLVKDLEDMEPVFADIRREYVHRGLEDSGADDPLSGYTGETGFIDAVATPEGGVCILSGRRTYRGPEQYRYTLVQPERRVNRRMFLYEGEDVFKPLPETLEHLSAAEARERAAGCLERFFDLRLDMIRGWCRD